MRGMVKIQLCVRVVLLHLNTVVFNCVLNILANQLSIISNYISSLRWQNRVSQKSEMFRRV